MHAGLVLSFDSPSVAASADTKCECYENKLLKIKWVLVQNWYINKPRGIKRSTVLCQTD